MRGGEGRDSQYPGALEALEEGAARGCHGAKRWARLSSLKSQAGKELAKGLRVREEVMLRYVHRAWTREGEMPSNAPHQPPA